MLTATLYMSVFKSLFVWDSPSHHLLCPSFADSWRPSEVWVGSTWGLGERQAGITLLMTTERVSLGNHPVFPHILALYHSPFPHSLSVP